MKILHINKHYLPFKGGTIRALHAIVQGLAESCDQTVLCCASRGRGRSYSHDRVRVKECGSLGVFFSVPMAPGFLPTCIQEVRRHDRVLIHLPFPGPDLAFMIAAPIKTDLLLWWHSDIVRQKWLMPLYGPIVRKALQRARHVIVSHPSVVRSSPVLRDFEQKCVFVPYGVERLWFDPVTPELAGEVARLRRATAKGRIFALFVGRLVYYKGIDVLLRAVKETNVHLGIVGVGALERELRQLTVHLGLTDRVSFFGEVTDSALRVLYEACHFLVLPSVASSESFGIVQMEAMAAGRPVINTALETAVPEISIHGISGLTVAPRDVVSLASAINRLAADTELRRMLGEQARERAANEYSIAAMLRRVKPLVLDPVPPSRMGDNIQALPHSKPV